jgi:ribosomal protein S18 acetylase RimI-like enzyme
MHVDPAFQRRGVGSRIIREAIGVMKSEYGCNTIRLDRTELVQKAVDFYHSIGFVSEPGKQYFMYEGQLKPFPTMKFTLTGENLRKIL